MENIIAKRFKIRRIAGYSVATLISLGLGTFIYKYIRIKMKRNKEELESVSKEIKRQVKRRKG